MLPGNNYELRIATLREALAIREVIGLQDQLSQIVQSAQEAGVALKQLTEENAKLTEENAHLKSRLVIEKQKTDDQAAALRGYAKRVGELNVKLREKG